MELLLLAAATTADIFAAAFGLGAKGIKLPARSAAAVSFTGAVTLWLSVLISSAADRVIPMDAALFISKAILFLMGLYAIFGDKLKRKGKPSPLNYAEVMNDPAISDSDNSRVISRTEAFALGAALSADSALTGVGAGLGGVDPLPVFFYAFFMGLAASGLGIFLGRSFSGKTHIRSGLPGGIILIILALML